VVAIGAPGSPARAACEHPGLIEQYQNRYIQSVTFSPPAYTYGEANDDLERQDGIKSQSERTAILSNTDIQIPVERVGT
jgi:hypothetical protein